VGAEQPAATVGALLGANVKAIRRRSQEAGSRLQASDPMLQIRGFKALAEATGNHAWEDRAFDVVADMVERSTLRLQRPHIDRREVQHVIARAAARIDFGGGWTDTPPHSIERGGTVLNAAVTLRGAHPIVAEVDRLPEPRLVLVSRDLDATLEPRLAGDVLAYANPADPFALQKAALVLRGVVPHGTDPQQPLADLLRERGGVRLSTGTNIPFGSGLGTSSILAGAVLAALHALGSGSSEEQGGRCAGTEEPRTAASQLFDEVLCLEQMLTTGGGWQDQVGGLTGGIKLVTTPPGLPQKITVQPVPLTVEVAEQFGERLLLVYTGQRRLAKNLLRAVMRRWMARDPEMTWIQGEIARLALAMREALSAGALDELGNLLTEHWTLNKRIDPGCTNPFIDELLDTMNPYVCGSKLAGAGGGGFVISIARSTEAAQTLSDVLAQRYPGTPVERWESAVPEIGLQVHAAS
jgi:fucokinase